MTSLSPSTVILILAVAAFTATAAFLDFRTKRIPNKLTLPMFFAGWVFQIAMSVMYGWHHLGSAVLGFAVGFGLLFLLWFIGGGGGGDVKLMGALSVWLGFQMTLAVLFVSTLLVLLATVLIVLSSIFKVGFTGMREKYLATGKSKPGAPVVVETRDNKIRRRVMAYAGPVALATWGVLFWNVPRIEKQLHADTPATLSTEATP